MQKLTSRMGNEGKYENAARKERNGGTNRNGKENTHVDNNLKNTYK